MKGKIKELLNRKMRDLVVFIEEIFNPITRKLIIMGSGLVATIGVVVNLYFGWLKEDNLTKRHFEVVVFSCFIILQIKMMYDIYIEKIKVE